MISELHKKLCSYIFCQKLSRNAADTVLFLLSLLSGETFSPGQDNISIVKHCQYSRLPYPNTEFNFNNMPSALAGKKTFIFIYNKKIYLIAHKIRFSKCETRVWFFFLFWLKFYCLITCSV